MPGPLPSGGGTRGAECRGAPSPLSSSPAERSALRGTPARPGLLSQSDGTPPPLAAAAASASSDSSHHCCCPCDERHLGSDGRGRGGDRGRKSQSWARSGHRGRGHSSYDRLREKVGGAQPVTHGVVGGTVLRIPPLVGRSPALGGRGRDTPSLLLSAQGGSGICLGPTGLFPPFATALCVLTVPSQSSPCPSERLLIH